MLHIPENTVQEVIKQLLEICEKAQPVLHNTAKDILKQRTDVEEYLVEEKGKVTMQFCGKNGSLSTTNRRAVYMNKNFTEVKPVEYLIERGKKCSFVYVPLNPKLKKMLNRADILDEALTIQKHVQHEYSSCRDGTHCNENYLLKGDEFKTLLDYIQMILRCPTLWEHLERNTK